MKMVKLIKYKILNFKFLRYLLIKSKYKLLLILTFINHFLIFITVYSLQGIFNYVLAIFLKLL